MYLWHNSLSTRSVIGIFNLLTLAWSVLIQLMKCLESLIAVLIWRDWSVINSVIKVRLIIVLLSAGFIQPFVQQDLRSLAKIGSLQDTQRQQYCTKTQMWLFLEIAMNFKNSFRVSWNFVQFPGKCFPARHSKSNCCGIALHAQTHYHRLLCSSAKSFSSLNLKWSFGSDSNLHLEL